MIDVDAFLARIEEAGGFIFFRNYPAGIVRWSGF